MAKPDPKCGLNRKIMAKCSKCKERKAKRYCQALGASLCSLCCGILREKKIHCPPDCPFLIQHKPYQERKIIQKKRAFSEDILHDERMGWLTIHIEAPLKTLGEKIASFSDKDAILALEYAKEKIEKEKSRIILRDDFRRPKNEAGEAVWESTEDCRYERTIILPGETGSYKKDEKLKCLENVILSAKYMARGNLEGRNYVESLKERFDRLKELSRQKKIIMSG